MALWIDAVLKPKETFASEKANASWKGALFNYAIVGILYGLWAGISVALFAQALGGLFGGGSTAAGGIASGIGIASIVIMPIIYIILIWIAVIIIQGILFIIAKLLGGTGSFKQQVYLVSLYAPILGAISLVLSIIGGLSILLALAFSVLGLIVWLFGLYLLTLAFKETHTFSTTKAVLTWLIPGIIIFILIIMTIGLAALFAFGVIQTPNTCSPTGGRIFMKDFSIASDGISLIFQNGGGSDMTNIQLEAGYATGCTGLTPSDSNPSALLRSGSGLFKLNGSCSGNISVPITITYKDTGIGITKTETTTCTGKV